MFCIFKVYFWTCLLLINAIFNRLLKRWGFSNLFFFYPTELYSRWFNVDDYLIIIFMFLYFIYIKPYFDHWNCDLLIQEIFKEIFRHEATFCYNPSQLSHISLVTVARVAKSSKLHGVHPTGSKLISTGW